MFCLAQQSGSPWQKVNGKWVVVAPVQQKFVTGKQKKLADIIKKYNATIATKTKVKEAPVQEWVDTSFITAYSDHKEMLNILEKIEADYPDLAKRWGKPNDTVVKGVTTAEISSSKV